VCFFEDVLQAPEAGGGPRVIAVEGADQHGGIEDNLPASAVSPVEGKAADPGRMGPVSLALLGILVTGVCRV
jgi:hypothetical protein